MHEEFHQSFFCAPKVGLPFPEFDVAYLLYLDNLVSSEEASGVTLVTVLPDRRLHLLFNSRKLGIVPAIKVVKS